MLQRILTYATLDVGRDTFVFRCKKQTMGTAVPELPPAAISFQAAFLVCFATVKV